MASVSLVESAKLAKDMMVAGVIENIITVNQMFRFLPFDGINGNSIQYNRENALGGVGVAGVGDTWDDATDRNPISGETAGMKAPATFTSVFSGLTRIGGDAEVDGLIQATRSSDGNDQTAVQIASKSKHAGRVFQSEMINGDGSGNRFEGMINLTPASQQITPGTNGLALTLEQLDELQDIVTAKDGEVDYFCMHRRERAGIRKLLRALGGAGINETVAMPGGGEIMAYNGIPVLRNDYIPINQTQGASGAVASTIFAGTFDDGSRSNGIAGLTAEMASGIRVVDVGESESGDEHIWRVKWYCGFALFSELGIASKKGVLVVP